ncbi:preQ(1) synthase [Rubricoccus marinus]|nr:preQ(1) synthase [Rubricoccus marinus]
MHITTEPAAPEAASGDSAEARLAEIQAQAAEHARLSIAHMARYGIKPEGRVATFLPPEVRQHEIHRLPYEHAARQRVSYETEPGEFTALCPFSGLPDSGSVHIEYVPGEWLLELKSLKYYLMSWRHIGAAQEDITAFMYEDLARHLAPFDQLVVTTDYTVRGGIHTVCRVDSREQASGEAAASDDATAASS